MGVEVLEHPFFLAFADRVDEAAVVVDEAAAGLGDRLVGARVGRVPAIEAVLFEVGRHRVFLDRRFRAVPLALVDDAVAGRSHHAGQVLQVRRQVDLGEFGRRHVFLERVLDPVLGGEVAAHQGRAGRRAHAGVGERALEADAVAPQPAHPRQVLAQPVAREVLDRPFLVGEEEDHVHPRDAPPPSPARGEHPLDPAAALGDERRRGGSGAGADQLFAGQASFAAFLFGHRFLLKTSTASLPKAVE